MAKLDGQGIIEPVKLGGVINDSPVVWQRKKDMSLRLWPDYKVNVNDKIVTEGYPLPDTETTFHKVSGAKSTAKIDLSSAYYQIELDDEAQKIATIITTQGLYRVKSSNKV